MKISFIYNTNKISYDKTGHLEVLYMDLLFPLKSSSSSILGVLFSCMVRSPNNGRGGMSKVYCDNKTFEENSGNLVCLKSGTYTFNYVSAQTYSSTGGLSINGEIKISIPSNASGVNSSVEIEVAAGDTVSLSVLPAYSQDGRYAAMSVEITGV